MKGPWQQPKAKLSSTDLYVKGPLRKQRAFVRQDYGTHLLLFPFLKRPMRSFAVTSSFLAQTNSVASIASPIGMTTTAGPGSTIMAIPTARTVKPVTTTTRRLACPNVLNI